MSSPQPPSAFWCSARNRDRAARRRAAHVLARRRQRRQGRARAVDVVDAPAAPPRPVGALRAPQVRDAPPHRRVAPRHAALHQRLHDVGRDVLGRGVDDLAEVAQRQLGHDPAVVVDVERAPAAVRALHGQQPVDAAADRRVRRGVAGAAQGDQHLGGVVGVGVPLVLELERPAARPAAARHEAPVADPGDLLREHPVARRLQRRVVAGGARVGQRDRRQARVPDGREARLDAQALAAVGVEGERVVEPVDRRLQHRVVQRQAQRVEGDDRVDPRRLDAAPRPVGLLALHDPLHHPPLRHPAQPRDRAPVVGGGDLHRPGEEPASTRPASSTPAAARTPAGR